MTAFPTKTDGGKNRKSRHTNAPGFIFFTYGLIRNCRR